MMKSSLTETSLLLSKQNDRFLSSEKKTFDHWATVLLSGQLNGSKFVSDGVVSHNECNRCSTCPGSEGVVILEASDESL